MGKYLKINGKVCLDTWRGMFRYLARYVKMLRPCSTSNSNFYAHLFCNVVRMYYICAVNE